MRARQRHGVWAAAMALLGLVAFGAPAQATDNVGLAMTGVTEIAAGALHTCAHQSGVVSCWGSNVNGALGDGTAGNARAVPRRVSGLPAGVVQVTAGGGHSCALTSGGDIWCWGDNAVAQVDYTAGPVVLEPRKLHITTEAGTPVRFRWVGAGGQHTCALSTTNVPWCWGEAVHGQLGRDDMGLTDLGPGPVEESFDDPWPYAVTLMAVGSDHTCMVSNGQLYCFGRNPDGRVGNGSTTTEGVFYPSPVSAANGFPAGGVTGISLGAAHSCASTQMRKVFCWGSNDFGRLGTSEQTGPTTSTTVPDQVEGGDSIDENASGLNFRADRVTAGVEHTCAYDLNGWAWCFGRGIHGQLGEQLPTTQRSRPLNTTWDASFPMMESVGRLSVVDAGSDHTCAISTKGIAYCWGLGAAGQLGDGSHASQGRPSTVMSPQP